MEAFLNDQFVPLDQMNLHVSDLAIQRGYGIFDFLKIKDHVPLFLNDYLDRFYRSAELMGLQGTMKRDRLREVIIDLIERNKMPEAGIKLILTGGYSPDGYQPVKGNLIITEHPLVLPSSAQVETGIKIITYKYRRDIPEAKTINYIMGIWLLKKVSDSGASDVLYHMDGDVSEFPRCNFFIVTKEGTLVTPDKNVLHGITRKNILRSVQGKFKVEVRSVAIDEVYTASEAFLTSTTKGILPIVNIDEQVIGSGRPGKVTLALRNALSAMEDKEIEEPVPTAKAR